MPVAISLIPKSLQRPLGKLHTIDLPLVMAQLKRQLIRYELRTIPFIAGIDISFNEHSRHEFPPHWQPHFTIYVVADELQIAPDGFRRFFPTDDTIPTP